MPAATCSSGNWRRGETILIKPTALIFKDPTVQMHLHFERPGHGVLRRLGLLEQPLSVAAFDGPGRVAMQSVFEPIEGEARNMTRFSYATVQRW